MGEYVAAADANRAWIALLDNDLDTSIELAARALDSWRQLSTLVFPFQWLATLPLLIASLRRDDLATAMTCAESLIAPTQQALPSSATDSLQAACAHWASGERTSSRSALDRALGYLEADGYG
jgi:hypothetical protein